MLAPFLFPYTSVQSNHEALKVLHAWQDVEKGAPAIAEYTPLEDAAIVLHQLRVLAKPLRSYELLIEAVRRSFIELVTALVKCKVNVNVCNAAKEMPFTVAVQNQCPELIKLFMQAGADVNVFTGEVETALNFYIKQGDVEEIKALIQAGVYVNTRAEGNITPLMQSARLDDKESIEIVSLLLEAGADLDARDALGNTALHHAALSQAEERGQMIALLCKQGIGLDIKNHAGQTAYHIAKTRQDLKALSALHAARFLMHMQHTGWSRFTGYIAQVPKVIDAWVRSRSLMLIRRESSQDAVIIRHARSASADTEALTQFCMPQQDSNEPTCLDEHFSLLSRLAPDCLHKVCTYITVQELTQLDQLSVSFVRKTHMTWGAHLRARVQMEKGAPDLVQHVHPLDAKCLYREIWKIDLPLRRQDYLHCATSLGCEKLMRTLIKANGHVNSCDAVWRTPLMCLFNSMELNKAAEMAKTLLEADADVNAQDSLGRTAVHYAIERGSLSSVALLVEARADLQAVDHEWVTCAAYAEKKGHIEIACFLRNALEGQQAGFFEGVDQM